MNIPSLISSIFGSSTAAGGNSSLATNVLGAVLGNATLSGLNTAALTAVKSAVTMLDNGIDELTSAFTKFETGNAVVTQATGTLLSLARSQGLQIPTEEVVVTHIKAAIAEVAASFGIGVVSKPAPAAAA